MHRVIPLLVMAAITTVVGCAKEERKPNPQEEPPQEFTFTDTNVVLTVEETGINDDDARTVKADFNVDGLEDFAIVDSDKDTGGKQVTIYVQKKKDPSQIIPKAMYYYKAGVINRTWEGDIIGLMTRKGRLYTDLIVLVATPNSPNEMIHYRNDGTKFEEVWHETTSPDILNNPPAQDQPPPRKQ